MGITRPMPEIDEFLRLADPGRTLGFIRDLEKTFKEIEVLGMAPVHSQIRSVAGSNKVSVIAYSSRQTLGSSLTLRIAKYILYSDSELRIEVF
jgi:hypothetical protein